MLYLPNGCVIDLSTHRAKYHALRNGGPTAQAPHRQLYSLVDVLFRYRQNDVVRRGWTQYDYQYSNHTLADIHHCPQIGDSDKAAIHRWLREPEQVRLIESARIRIPENLPQLAVKLNSAPQNLYSLLQQRIERLGMMRATKKQWLATLLNMQRQGLRREELYWSGLLEFLKQRGDGELIDKQSLLETLDFDNIRLQMSTELIAEEDGCLSFIETAQQLLHQAVYRATLGLDDSCLCILRYHDQKTNYRIGVVKTLDANHPMALNKYWFAMDPYGRAIMNAQGKKHFSSSDEAIIAANDHAYHQLGIRGGHKFHSQYDHLSLYGGYDYREWRVSLTDYQRHFFGAHHIDHNVLLHIRTTTRVDAEGNKILFIEEIQSDWHQQACRYGYDNNPWGRIAHAPFKKEWQELAVKLLLIRASQNGYDGIAWTPGYIQELRYGKSLTAIKRHYDVAIPDCLRRLGRPFGLNVGHTRIATCEPWLNLVREAGKWRVEDAEGKFKTRNKYASREQAMALIYRHSRHIQMQVPVFLINEALRWQIAEQGLPLFGTTFQ